jgi:hypothetical protein
MVGLEKPARMMRKNCLDKDNRIVVRQDMHPDCKNVPRLHMRPEAVFVKCVRARNFVTNQITYYVKQNTSFLTCWRSYVNFQVFMPVKIHIVVWVITYSSLVIG